MGYLYLFLALIGGLVKGFSGKKISNDVHTLKDCLFVNFLRVLFCAVFSFLILLADPVSNSILPPMQHLPFYLFSALCMAAFCVVFMFGYKTAAYMYLSVFGMLGSVITGLLGCLIYNESLSPGKVLGMVALILAVLVMSKYNKMITLKETKKTIPLLIFAAVSVALSDFSQKIFVYEIGESAAMYNFYTYGFAALLLLPMCLILKGNLQQDSPHLLRVQNWLICLLISAALFVNSYSKTLAAKFLTAAEIYPVLQGANLILSAILTRLLLKEKITMRCLLGMGVAFLGLILMNFC